MWTYFCLCIIVSEHWKQKIHIYLIKANYIIIVFVYTYVNT